MVLWCDEVNNLDQEAIYQQTEEEHDMELHLRSVNVVPSDSHSNAYKAYTDSLGSYGRSKEESFYLEVAKPGTRDFFIFCHLQALESHVDLVCEPGTTFPLQLPNRYTERPVVRTFGSPRAFNYNYDFDYSFESTSQFEVHLIGSERRSPPGGVCFLLKFLATFPRFKGGCCLSIRGQYAGRADTL
jgi:hypothetical protein